MPRATVSTEVQHFDLKTCPGGWVKLKPLTYGQVLHRVDNAATQVIEGRDAKTGMPTRTAIETMIARTRQYEFQHCIVEHNLEDDNGAILNFAIASTFDKLDPKVGEEVGDLIDTLNGDNTNEQDFFKQLGESVAVEEEVETKTTA